MLYNSEFIQLLETNYVVDPNIQQRMINTVLSQKDTANYYGGYTFHIKDAYDDFKNLYNYFLKSVLIHLKTYQIRLGYCCFQYS